MLIDYLVFWYIDDLRPVKQQVMQLNDHTPTSIAPQKIDTLGLIIMLNAQII